jgi:hypothetical protein
MKRRTKRGRGPSPLPASQGPPLTWRPLQLTSRGLRRCVPAEMVLNGDRAIDRAVAAVQPHIGIFLPVGDECCAGDDRDNSLTWGFIGPTVFTDSWGCHDHDVRAIPVGHRGHGALVQEGLPLVFLAGVLQVWRCPLVYAALISHVYVLTLNGGVGVIGVAPLRSRSFISLHHIRQHSYVCPWWCPWLRARVT